MLAMETGWPEVTSKISRWFSGRLHNASFVPSGLSATGCTGAVSKLKKFVVLTCACAETTPDRQSIAKAKRAIIGFLTGLLDEVICIRIGPEKGSVRFGAQGVRCLNPAQIGAFDLWILPQRGVLVLQNDAPGLQHITESRNLQRQV